MNKELQQKIIGGTIIVVFLAIAIPFLFAGNKKANLTSQETTTEKVSIPTQNLPEVNQQSSSVISSQAPNLEQQPSQDNGLNQNTEQTQTQNQVQIQEQVLDQNQMQNQSTNVNVDANTNANDIKAVNNIETSADNSTLSPQNQLSDATFNTNDESSLPKTSSQTLHTPQINNNATTNNTNLSANTPSSVDTHTTKNNQVSQPKTHTNKTVANRSHKNDKIKNVTHKTISQAKTSQATHLQSKALQDKKQWIVSAGLYQDKNKAMSLVKKLQKDNYQALIRTENHKQKNKTFYRVVLKPIYIKTKAENLSQRIAKNLKVKTMLMEEPKRLKNAKN